MTRFLGDQVTRLFLPGHLLNARIIVMLETAYLIAKILMSSAFFIISIFLIAMSFEAKSIKDELISSENQIRKELNVAYNVGAAAVTLVLTLVFSGPGVKAPLFMSVLSYVGLTKYKNFYHPLNNIWKSGKDLFSQILSFRK